jgi:hypothetical protein
MENMVDLLAKFCIYPECKVRANYNYRNETKAIYCTSHKLDGMMNINHSTCNECDKIPTYNFKGQKKPILCFDHKQSTMVNVVSKTCKNEWCPTIVENKHEGYCLFCFVNMFPDKPIATNYKTKETAVVNFVKQSYPTIDWICDKRVSDGCSKRRPDLLLDLGYQIIIVEIDENQHIDYDCSCENKRIMELSQDLGHRPIVFIRFNPDDYNHGDKHITSCWNTKGLCVVKKYKRKEWQERLDTLKVTIDYWLENMTNKTVEVIQLYYDL